MDVPTITTTGASISPWALFLHADIIVKLVMIGLLAASVWTWAIIISHSKRLSRIEKSNEAFERDFWQTEDIDRFYEGPGRKELPVANVFSAAVAEWRRSTKGPVVDREGTRSRLATAMNTAAAAESDKLSDRLSLLATIGSVAPFVGLFGTVWGIMRSFSDIAAAQNTSLAVVAPGIAEALFATALGLFAAIPAVIAYNRLSHRVNRIDGQTQRFGESFHTMLSRELEIEKP
ncbi:MAG: protein TolQ [Sphingomonadaceae bacterium]